MIDADEDDDDADVTLPLSLASAHLFPAPNLARHTLPSNDLYPVYVRICTILEKTDFYISETQICADLIHANLCQTLNTEIRIESV